MSVEKNTLIIIKNPLNQSDRRIIPIDYDPGRTLREIIIKHAGPAGPPDPAMLPAPTAELAMAAGHPRQVERWSTAAAGIVESSGPREHPGTGTPKVSIPAEIGATIAAGSRSAENSDEDLPAKNSDKGLHRQQRGCHQVSLEDLTIVKNKIVILPYELDLPLMPGDMIHIIPKFGKDGMRSLGMLAVTVLAYYYVGPAAAGYLEAAGMSAGAASMWGMIAATAVVSAGGMLFNGNLPNPVKSIRGSVRESSPTYGWSIGDNTAQEGVAIPALYGAEATYPQIINQWLECTDMYGTDATHEQWWHVLLCVANGQTNNVPTADDIELGDMPLTTLDAGSYTLETTDGGPAGGILTNHEYLHQMKRIDKELLITSVSQILLHMNGNDGSTDIIEDGVGTGGNYKIPGETGSLNTWTCNGSAALSTDNPFIGSAALEIPTGSNNYLRCDNYRAFALWTQSIWDFECRFRQSTLTDCCIVGQLWIESGVTLFFWSICYNSAGQITFQQVKKDVSGPSYTIYINLSGSASLSIDTWHHIRVARSGSTVYIFLDGTLLTSGTYSVTPVFAAGDIQASGNLTIGHEYYIEDCDTGHFYYLSEPGEIFTATEVTSLDANNTVRDINDGDYLQTFGYGYYYTGSAESLRDGGPIELDEVRLRFKELIYDDLASYTPPTNAIADENEQIYFTKGAIDGFWINLLCSYGLYFNDTGDGSVDPAAVETWVSWRKVGTTTWEREYFGFLEFSRSPVMFQRFFQPAGGRGYYEIRVTRIIWEWALDYSANQFQTTCFLSSIDEVLFESLKYPHLQTFALSIKAQEKLSGRPSPIRVKSNRTLITVPNYNGIGTRTVDPRNNAHAVFDAMTNSVYGLDLDPERIIQADWEEWADWCDGSVAGESRCRLNMVFDADYTFDDALQHIEACGRARVVNRGSKIGVVVDTPKSHTDIFCNENIAPGSEKVTWLRQAEKSDGVEITFRDADKNFEEDSVFYPGTGYYSLTRLPRIQRIPMLGIKSRDQATREAILRQQISESKKRALSLQSGFESLKVKVGDVVKHGSRGNLLVFTGRLARGAAREEQYSGTTVYLDKEITLDSATFSGDCVFITRNNDDSINEFTVTGPFDSATWLINVSASGTFDFLAPWIIGRTTEKYLYKVNSVSRGQKKDALIEAQTYDATAYYHADYDSGSTPI